ncbi:MAG: tail fiber domain-containing protein [Candidatus Magasanikbacteria bacterium]|nr:tail fiber domain-containing protein [Candidatus Magasanikbacteria bacterium]
MKSEYFRNVRNSIFLQLSSFIILTAIIIAPFGVRAITYSPGETLNPVCGPTDPDCGVTPLGPEFTTPISITNGSVSSSLRADGLYIATSTSNLSGLFFVDSTGSVSASGTLKIFGTSIFTLGEFTSITSTNISGTTLQISATTTLTTSTITGGFFQTGLGDCSMEVQTLLYDASTGKFMCGVDTSSGSATSSDFTTPVSVTNGTNTSLLTATGLMIATSSSDLSGLFLVNGGGSVSASGTLQIFGNTTLAGLTLTNGTSTNFFSTGLAFTNLSGTNATTTNLAVSGLAVLADTTITSVTSTNAFFTTLAFGTANGTSLTSTNISFTNLNGVNVTSTNLSGTNLAFGVANGTSITSTNAFFTNLAVSTLNPVNITATNATTTNLAVSGLAVLADTTITSVTSTNAFFTTLAFGTANGTSLTSTNISFTNLNGVNVTSTNLSGTNLAFGVANGTSITSTNAFFTNLAVSTLNPVNITATNITTTNFNASGLITLPSNSITDDFVVNGLTIDGGTINNTSIGATLASTGIFTRVTSTEGMSVSGTLYLSDASLDHRPLQFLSDDSFGDYMISQGSFANPSGRDNQIFRIGFNKRYGGVPPGEVAFGMDFESYYLQAPNDPVLEAHTLSIVDTDGSELRPLSFQYHYLAGTTTMRGKTTAGFKLDQLNFHSSTGTVEFATLRPHEFGLIGVGIQQNENNFNWLRQMNAAGDGTVEIARIDDVNTLRLAPDGAPIFIPSSARGALSIAGTSTYALLNIGVGPSASSSGIGFQDDVNLYRQQANVLATDDVFTIVQPSTADGLILSSSDSTITAGLRVAGSALQVACKTVTCNRALFGVGGITQSLGSSIDTYSTGLIIFYNDDAAEGMRLTAGGNLLVGTTADNGRFAVSGTAYISENLRINTVTALAGLTIATTSNFSDLITFNTATGSSVTTTNLSYSTASGTTLRANSFTVNNVQVDGSILVGAAVPGKYINFYDTNYGITAQNGLELKTADAIQFLTGTTQRMVIDSNGDIGIGINSLNAAAKLQFTTSTVASGGILFGGDTNLYRSSNDILRTDDALQIGGALQFVMATGTSITSTNAFITNLAFTNASGTNVTSTNIFVAGSFNQTALAEPSILGGVSLGGIPGEVKVFGKYAYTIGIGSYDLNVIDVSNPTTPVNIGSVDDSEIGLPGDLFVTGNNVYVTAAESLHVIDVSNPTTPSVVGRVTSTAITASAVYVSGKYAYVSGDSSLQVIDISNSTNLSIVGSVVSTTALGDLSSIYVSGKYVYATERNTDSLRIIDISNPVTPTIVGSVVSTTALNDPWSVYVSGKYAYVANESDDSLRIIDISSSTAPSIVGGIKDAANLNGARSVYVSGKYAYVAARDDDSIRIINISSSTNPVIVGGVKHVTLLDDARSVYVSGKYAYVANGAGGTFRIIDLGGIDAPSANIGALQVNTANVTDNLTVANNAYVSNGLNVGAGGISTGGLVSAGSVDVSIKSNPAIVGFVASSTALNSAISTYVSGKYVYVANLADNSLRIVDISNPTSPTIVGGVVSSTVLQGARAVYAAGKYAYVASYDANSLSVVDISNPTTPSIVGSVVSSTALNIPVALYVSGKYAYVTSFLGDSFAIVDVSNPATPTIVNSIVSSTVLGGANAVYVSGKYAYVTAADEGRLTVLDISNPATPTVVSSMTYVASSADSVYVSGKYAYVAGYGGTVSVVDISNPVSSTVVGTISSSQLNGARSIQVAGKYAYVANTEDTSLRVIDISNPTQPSIVGGVVSSTALNGISSIHISGKYAYAASYGSHSLSVIDLGGIDAPSANIGSLQSSNISVTENLTVGNNAYITNSLNVGMGGIFIDGGLSAAGTTTLSGLVVSSSLVYMPNLAAPGATSDYLCFDTGGKITHQAGNCTVSSQRFKHDIETWNGGLSTILELRPVTYKRNHDEVEELGLIAEEVDLVNKHLVIYEPSSTTPRSVDYARLVIPLISAVQSQQQQIDGLLLATAGVNSSTPRTLSEEELLYAANRPIASALTFLVNRLAGGASIIKDFLAERVTAVVGVFDKIRTEEMEMTDSVTGEIYCIRIANGEWEKLPGDCDLQGELMVPGPVPEELGSSSASEEAVEEPEPESVPQVDVPVEPQSDPTPPEEETVDSAPSFIDQLIQEVQDEINNSEETSEESSSTPSDSPSGEIAP